MYTILMNRHIVSNGNFDTIREVKDRLLTLKGIFKHSKFEVLINI